MLPSPQWNLAGYSFQIDIVTNLERRITIEFSNINLEVYFIFQSLFYQII
jgi:hypothetical protein